MEEDNLSDIEEELETGEKAELGTSEITGADAAAEVKKALPLACKKLSTLNASVLVVEKPFQYLPHL